MLIVHVHVKVKPDSIDAFKSATLKNAQNSLKEPGVARFDVIQKEDDPARFILVEVYRTAYAPAQHKETEHYAEWKKTVGPMMALPRESFKFVNLFPDDRKW